MTPLIPLAQNNSPRHIPRIIIAGTHSGSGKTSVTLALMAALARQGVTVSPYKVGPDYIDPAFHTYVTGTPSRNLDSWLLTPEAIRHIFQKTVLPSSVAIIEGVMGLFDGQGTEDTGSTAHVATILDAPVLLVINGEGLSRSAAALVAGYAHFHPHVSLAGVIINRVSSQKHYEILHSAITEHTAIPCLGYLQKNKDIQLQHRHLGLVPSAEIPALQQCVERLIGMAESTLDIPRILARAHSAPALPPAPFSEEAFLPKNNSPHKVRIGIAKDKAFSFYYEDNLALLHSLGATLVPFSPLTDTALPEALHGLYLGGGFPEVYAAQLAANTSFKTSVKNVLEQGMPAYAECGGMLYLMESLAVSPAPERNERVNLAVNGGLKGAVKGEPAMQPAMQPAMEAGMEPVPYPMVGFLPYHGVMTERLQNFGYITVTLQHDCCLGAAGTQYKAHEFHYSKILAPQPPCTAEPACSTKKLFFPTLTAVKPDGRHWEGGFCQNNVFAAYPHVHFYSAPHVAQNFLAACLRYKQELENTSCP